MKHSRKHGPWLSEGTRSENRGCRRTPRPVASHRSASGGHEPPVPRPGAAGQLVQLQVTSAGGEVLARPRLIAPAGKQAEVVLHDPARPGEVRLALRIEAARDPSGEIELRYALWIPERALSMHGRVSLTPGVEQELPLGDGTLVASILALPVPSAAFDAYLEAEGARRAMGRTS